MIISISGNKGAGKDYVGKIIQILTLFPEIDVESAQKMMKKALSNNIFEIKKWAEIPNKAFKTITGIDYSNLPRSTKEIVRPDFIKFANVECKRMFGEDIWVRRLLEQYVERKFSDRLALRKGYGVTYSDLKPNWVITDTRLSVEFTGLEGIENVLYIHIEGTDDASAGNDPTETEFKAYSFQYYINNKDKNFEKLFKDVRFILKYEKII